MFSYGVKSLLRTECTVYHSTISYKNLAMDIGSRNTIQDVGTIHDTRYSTVKAAQARNEDGQRIVASCQLSLHTYVTIHHTGILYTELNWRGIPYSIPVPVSTVRVIPVGVHESTSSKKVPVLIIHYCSSDERYSTVR
jgi:hypothetical protein